MKKQKKCPKCNEEMEEGHFWKRISTKIFAGPPNGRYVKETIEYQELYVCPACEAKKWINELPNEKEDPDLEEYNGKV